MTLTIRLGVAVGLVVVALSAASMFASPTQAQNPPATFYGTARSGDRIEALIGGRVCTSTTAGADGFWMFTVDEGGACGATEGATVTFTLGARACTETELWKAGGAPRNVASGVTLSNCTAGAATVTPPSTGNAGLLPQGGATSPWLALMLGAFALAGLAGARAMTGRNRS